MKRRIGWVWALLAVFAVTGMASLSHNKAGKAAASKPDACCPEHAAGAPAGEQACPHHSNKAGAEAAPALPPGHPAVDLSKPVKAPALTEEQLAAAIGGQTGKPAGSACPHLANEPDRKSGGPGGKQ